MHVRLDNKKKCQCLMFHMARAGKYICRLIFIDNVSGYNIILIDLSRCEVTMCDTSKQSGF